jgi:hypothetical protein
MPVLLGEFRESLPQSLDFQVNYDSDLNLNIPGLRVKYHELHRSNLVKVLAFRQSKSRFDPQCKIHRLP